MLLSGNIVKVLLWFFGVGGFFICTQCFANHQIAFNLVLPTYAVIFSCLVSGSAWFVSRRVPRDLLFILIAGCIYQSVATLLVCLCCHSIRLSFCITTALNIAILIRKRFNHSWLQVDIQTTLATVIALGATTIWCNCNIGGVVLSGQTVSVHPQQDIFFHASNVLLFAHANGQPSPFHSVFSCAESMPIYHYGSYILSAVIKSLSDAPLLSITSGFYCTFGYFLCTASSYILGCQLVEKKRASLLGELSSVFLPDAAMLHLGPIWCSYFFMQQVGIGANYAIAAFSLAWCCLFRLYRKVNARDLLEASFFLFAAVVFKIQIFLAYAPVLVGFLLWSIVKSRKWKLRVMAAYSLIVVTAMEITKFLNVPALYFDPSAIHSTITLLSDKQAYKSFYEHVPLWVGISATPPLYLVSTFGALCLLLPVLFFVQRKKSHLLFGFISCFALISWTLLVSCLIAPNNYSAVATDPYEITNKTFVWPVFFVGTFTGAVSCCYLESVLKSPHWRAAIFTIAISTFSFFAFQTSKHLFPVTIHSGGLFKCGLFLRKTTTPQSTVQLSSNDDFQILTTSSERFPWMSVQAINTPTSSAMLLEKERNFKALVEQGSFNETKSFCQAKKIRFIVLTPELIPAKTWPVPVFNSFGYRIFETED